MVFSKKYFWIVLTIAIFVIDRITKIMVMNHLLLGEPLKIFPFLNFFFTFNTGAAFNLLSQAGGWQEWLFGLIAVGVSIGLIIWQFRISIQFLWLKTASALVLGGTLGNLYDRIVYHKVIDFLDFYYKQWHYPVFNIADSAICIGAAMMVIHIMWLEKRGS